MLLCFPNSQFIAVLETIIYPDCGTGRIKVYPSWFGMWTPAAVLRSAKIFLGHVMCIYFMTWFLRLVNAFTSYLTRNVAWHGPVYRRIIFFSFSHEKHWLEYRAPTPMINRNLRWVGDRWIISDCFEMHTQVPSACLRKTIKISDSELYLIFIHLFLSSYIIWYFFFC